MPFDGEFQPSVYPGGRTRGPCGGGSSRLELESTNADFVTRHFRR